MFDLFEKTAVVTGATGGIGQAIAVALHAQGARVVITGRRMEALEDLAKTCPEDRYIPMQCDLSQDEDVAQLIEKAQEALGHIDILVNNAGITKDTLMMRMKDEAFDAVVDMNLKVPFQLARNALRGMIKNKYGRIINITSVVGVTGNPGQANYCASKAGIIGMSKALAAEVASRGITVNCVAPGFIKTAMTDVLKEAHKEALEKNIPIGSIGAAEDIAAAVTYLASQEAGYVTGQTLHVNGGMAMI